MKTPRAERLVDMTHYLVERPRTLVPLTFLLTAILRLSHQFPKI